jgi:hypothetical protein
MPEWTFGVIFGLVFIAIIVLVIWQTRRFSRPNIKIDPMNRDEADAIVVGARYLGSMGWGWTQRPLFRIDLNVHGTPMYALVPLQDEIAIGIQHSINSMRRAWGGAQKPFEAGQPVRIEFDRRKPKRCNIITPTNQQTWQMQNQQPQQWQQQQPPRQW